MASKRPSIAELRAWIIRIAYTLQVHQPLLFEELLEIEQHLKQVRRRGATTPKKGA